MLDMFMVGVLLAFMSFIAVEIWALLKWKGTWRAVAGATAVLFLLLNARIALDLVVNPASHNMWPFEVLIWSGLGLLVLGVASLVRVFTVERTVVP